MRKTIHSLIAATAVLALSTSFSAQAGDAPPLSPTTQALIAPVHEAFVTVDANQARLPSAKTDSERLERMFDSDQAGRKIFMKIDFSHVPRNEQPAAQAAAWKDIETHDLTDQKALKAMMPLKGWFTSPPYSAKAVIAAFSIVQHAGRDSEFQHDALKRMKPLAERGINGEQYGMLYDRVSLDFDHMPQRYGTQVECKSGQWQPLNLEDPAHVDARRKTMGFDTTEAEYLTGFARYPCN